MFYSKEHLSHILCTAPGLSCAPVIR